MKGETMKPQTQTETLSEIFADVQEIRPQALPKIQASRKPTLLCVILAEYEVTTRKLSNAQVLDAILTCADFKR